MSHHLPHLLNVIADVTAPIVGGRAAGVALALEIARHRGGQRVHIPARLTAEHWLVQIVGMDAARAICDHFSGTDIDLPLGPCGSYVTQRRARARKYEEAFSAGASANEAAAAAGVTRRAAHSAKSRIVQRGPDLFSKDKPG